MEGSNFTMKSQYKMKGNFQPSDVKWFSKDYEIFRPMPRYERKKRLWWFYSNLGLDMTEINEIMTRWKLETQPALLPER